MAWAEKLRAARLEKEIFVQKEASKVAASGAL
jgi:hypothetical protein